MLVHCMDWDAWLDNSIYYHLVQTYIFLYQAKWWTTYVLLVPKWWWIGYCKEWKTGTKRWLHWYFYKRRIYAKWNPQYWRSLLGVIWGQAQQCFPMCLHINKANYSLTYWEKIYDDFGFIVPIGWFLIENMWTGSSVDWEFISQNSSFAANWTE